MLNNNTIAVVVPAYNEEIQIGSVIETMPDFVDRIVVINDNSNDRTAEIVNKLITEFSGQIILPSLRDVQITNKKYQAERYLIQYLTEELKYYPSHIVVNTNENSDRLILINHLKNYGKGAGIATGYKWCKDHGIDCVATMDADGQMDPSELESICKPVVDENIDYVKGNRLIHQSAYAVIPKLRFFGNSVLSILTKIASGYWHVSDTQTGYTAISKKAINSINLFSIYHGYGYLNNMLVKLNIAFCTVKEVEIKPIYNIGEISKMKVQRVIPRIAWLLFKSFFIRLWQKYLFRDFHPLFLLYNISFLLILGTIPYGIKILYIIWKGASANPLTVLAFFFLFITGFQSLLFAMWMDIQDNERLYKS
jgi:glycosyltransferase involved in cell wall biosynthesis